VAVPSRSSFVTINDAEPSLATAFGPARVVPASAALSRRSTLQPSCAPLTLIRQRSPAHLNDSIFADTVAVPPGRMTICGTTHSCKLKPPWLYSSPAMKQSMPGGHATRTSSAQNQEKHGSSTVALGLTTAQR